MRGIMHTQLKAGYKILKTAEFQGWLNRLPAKSKSIVLARLDMLAIGHFGDHKRFDGLFELRWMNGTRLYGFFWQSNVVLVLFL